MDKDDDFTFWQVGTPTPVDQDLNETQQITENIANIELNDKLKNGVLQKDENTSNSISKKEAAFGSLSFTVTDKSTSKQSNEMPKPVPSQNGENAVKVLPGPSAVRRKPAPRAKVAFEKGYSPVDWLKLTRTHPDLAGLKGQTNRRLIPMAEVKLHRSEGSMWTVLKGRVYNISPYMKFHPGGDEILKAVGKDCTSLFNKHHAWVNDEVLMEKCLVGILDVSQ